MLNLKNCIGYLAAKNYEHELRSELKRHKIRILCQFDKLFIVEKPSIIQKIHWVQNIWYEPECYEIKSITDAAKILKKQHKQWRYYPYAYNRRSTLIEENLPKYKIPLKIDFPFLIPTNYSLGSLWGETFF